MTECSAQLTLGFHPKLPVCVDFKGPEISSDGGVVLLRQIDDRLGLTAGFAACLPDTRAPGRVLHDRREQTRQGLYQIAQGYEDCNDADTLRHDPLLKTVCDPTPNEPVGLSSQPTLSRAYPWRHAFAWLAQRMNPAQVPDNLTALFNPPQHSCAQIGPSRGSLAHQDPTSRFTSAWSPGDERKIAASHRRGGAS